MVGLVERLAEAREAYHALLIGRAVVTIRDGNGEEITYSRASANNLQTYIFELERLTAGSRPVTTIRFNTSKGL